jgi:hypothetical protein
MSYWRQQILNTVLRSVVDSPDRGNYFSVQSSGVDESGTQLQVVFREEGFDYGLWENSSSLASDKWVDSNKESLESDQTQSSIRGMLRELTTSEVPVTAVTREVGDLTFELQHAAHAAHASAHRLSIASRVPAVSSDDFSTEGQTFKYLIEEVLETTDQLRSHDHSIGATRVDKAIGRLCVSVRAKDVGEQGRHPSVIVREDFTLDEDAQTFIAQNYPSLNYNQPFLGVLSSQLSDVLTGRSSTRQRSMYARTAVREVGREGQETHLEIVFSA